MQRAFTTWRQRPVRPKRGFDVGFKMIPPSRRRLDGRDAIFQHDVMRCVFERQSGEPAPVHQGPGHRPVIMTAMAQQKAGELLARLPATRAPPPVARAPDRGSPHGLGLEPTPTTVHPRRCNLARLIASRRSVLTRSPGLRGINDGATTHAFTVPSFAQLALNAVTARAGLIAKSKPPAMTRQLRRQCPQRRRRVRDLAILAESSPACPPRQAPPRLLSLCTSRPT